MRDHQIRVVAVIPHWVLIIMVVGGLTNIEVPNKASCEAIASRIKEERLAFWQRGLNDEEKLDAKKWKMEPEVLTICVPVQ